MKVICPSGKMACVRPPPPFGHLPQIRRTPVGFGGGWEGGRKETTMSHNRDKGSKEQKKKAKRNIKEKRKLKKEKKQKSPFGVG